MSKGTPSISSSEPSFWRQNSSPLPGRLVTVCLVWSTCPVSLWLQCMSVLVQRLDVRLVEKENFILLRSRSFFTFWFNQRFTILCCCGTMSKSLTSFLVQGRRRLHSTCLVGPIYLIIHLMHTLVLHPLSGVSKIDLSRLTLS